MIQQNSVIRYFLFFAFVWIPSIVIAQKKPTKSGNNIKPPVTVSTPVKPYIVSYELSASGDTINIIDNENRKQGWWIEKNTSPTSIIQGERDVYIGPYLNNLKNGKWQHYIGAQLVSEENYKLGEKDGEVKVYEDGKLSIKGNYLAINRSKPFDTLDIEDQDGKVMRKIVKTDKGSYRQGEWMYFYPNSTKIMRTEYFFMDELVDSRDYDMYDSLETKKLIEYRKTAEKPAMWNYSKKGDAPRYSDVNPDGKGVKPNVRTTPRKTKK